jgi:hypothetical protein
MGMKLSKRSAAAWEVGALNGEPKEKKRGRDSLPRRNIELFFANAWTLQNSHGEWSSERVEVCVFGGDALTETVGALATGSGAESGTGREGWGTEGGGEIWRLVAAVTGERGRVGYSGRECEMQEGDTGSRERI